jgi:hypothetical protein
MIAVVHHHAIIYVRIPESGMIQCIESGSRVYAQTQLSPFSPRRPPPGRNGETFLFFSMRKTFPELFPKLSLEISRRTARVTSHYLIEYFL